MSEITILHLSDIHFRKKKDEENNIFRHEVQEKLIEAVAAHSKEHGAPDFVAVTGDIAFSGMKHEYDEALDFFKKLKSILPKDTEFLVVPGNHDVDRKKVNEFFSLHKIVKEGHTDKFLESRNKINNSINLKFKSYRNFIDRLNPGLYKSKVDFFWVKNFEEKNVSFLGLNSCWASEKDEEELKIALGYQQVIDALEKSKITNRVVLLHHPLSDWLEPKDIYRCKGLLFNSSGLILHGHVHVDSANTISTPSDSCIILGANATYTHDGYIGFQFLRVEFQNRVKVRVWPYRLDDREKIRFVPDTHCWVGQKGKVYFDLETHRPCGDDDEPDRRPLQIPGPYRDWIIEFHSRMDIQYLDPNARAFHIPLPEIYIPIETANPFYKPDEKKLKKDREIPIPVLADEGHDKADDAKEGKEPATIDIEVLLGRQECILLRSSAGMGKTTLIKHLAYTLIQGHGPGSLFGCLPVVVFLKDLWPIYEKESAAPGLTFPALLNRYLENNVKTLTWEEVEGFVKQNRALFLLDGLDEVPAHLRPALTELIAGFWIKNKKNRFLLTGRPHGIDDQVTGYFGRYLRDIELLDDKKIKEFIRQWFRVVSGRTIGLAEETAVEMIGDILVNEYVSLFTQNPLLLTAVCVLYLDNKRLPDQRAELYCRIVDNLLYRRFHRRDFPGRVTRIEDYLKSLAFRMMTENRRTMDIEEAKELLSPLILTGQNKTTSQDKRKINALFNEIEPQCGLLKRVGEGKIEFFHLCLQEFLAARYMLYIDMDYKQFLEKQWWEETILLYIGLINRELKEKANGIVREILAYTHNDEKILHRLWLLGAKALRDIQEYKRDDTVVALAKWKLIKVIESEIDFSELFEEIEIPLRKIDELENMARNLIKDQEYLKARFVLQEVLDLEPECEIAMQNEFGFLYDFKNTPEKDQEQWMGKKEVINHWKNLWCVLSENNKFQLKIRDADKSTHLQKEEKPIEKEKTKKTKEPTDALNHSQLPSHQKGEILEKAVLRLFRKFFLIAEDVEETILVNLRKQKKGPQFGHDISFECISRDNEKVTCKIECKNVEDSITEKDISHKLLAAENSDQKIDHWILFSVRSDPSNYLEELLVSWKKKERFPFEIHFWTPESGIKEFFGLEPGIYNKFYGNETINNPHPKDWTEQEKLEVYAKWKDKLKVKPFARLPKVWKEYIKNPGKMLLKEERGRLKELEILYNNRVELRCKDKKSTLLNDTMEAHVRQWLEDDKKNVMFILGEFGAGKTAFTYFLSRNLALDFLNDPENGWIPVRFSLKYFQSVKDPQTFLHRRLSEFNADPGSWNDLRNEKRNLLVILDGFDEMTPKLDPRTIKQNIRDLTDCCNEEFKGMKIIITSRTHFFENKQDEKLLLQRLGNPPIFYLAPIERQRRIEYLEKSIADPKGKEILRTLCKLHDPLDLASKPLFLNMFEATLNKLKEEKPDESRIKEINEISIYDNYVESSLKERKIDLLESEKSDEIDDWDDLVSNLKKILEQIAIKIQESNSAFISLQQVSNDFEQKYDEKLWKISDPGKQVNENETEKYDSSEDAAARVQVRSLLERKIGDNIEEQRPVKFCHRSMCEYFVAKGICRALLEDKKRAGELLAKLPLNHEILNFTAQLMKKASLPNYKKNLIEITKSSSNEINTGTPGGNAITLLFRLLGALPNEDWSGLNLDGANLSGADLSGMKFKGTTMRYANLDNVIFEGANFRDSDLTGVGIEETAPVLAVTTRHMDNRIFAAYKDNTIREWKSILKTGNAESQTVFEDTKGDLIGLEIFNDSYLCAVTNEEMIFYEFNDKEKLIQKARFRIKPGYRRLLTKGNILLFLSEFEKQTNKLHLVDLDKFEEVESLEQEKISLCETLDLQAFAVTDGKEYLRVEGTEQTQNEEILDISLQETTSLCVYTCEEDKKYLMACGQSNGNVSVWQLERLNGKWDHKLLVINRVHDGMVSTLSFLDETRIVSGGIDRKISILKFGEDSDDLKGHQENILHMTIKCKGMKIDGLKGSKEQEMFKKLIQNE